MNNNTVGYYFDIFWKNRKRLITINSIVLVLAIILVFFVIKPIFLSEGIIKTTSKSSGLSGLLSGSGLPDVGDFADLGGGSEMTRELSLFENILTSRRCVEGAILKFNLFEENSYRTMFDAVKDFRENILLIKKDKTAGILSIGIFDEEPQRAKEIADYMISELNKINIELNVQNARNNRVFIEERYRIVKEALTVYEDSLERFQNENGISPDLKVQAVSKIEIELQAEIKSEEVKLELLRKILSPEESEIVSQHAKIEALKKQLLEIQNSNQSENDLGLKGAPKVIIDFYRLKREVEIQNKILVTLIPMLEQAKIEENRDTPTILVVDSPFIPDKKSKPKRMIMIFLMFASCFIISYSYYFVKEKFKGIKNFDN